MKKYIIDIKIKGIDTNFAIVGYQGMKKYELLRYLDDFLKEHNWNYGGDGTIINTKGISVGFYDIYKNEISLSDKYDYSRV